jgi:hypothetical protein
MDKDEFERRDWEDDEKFWKPDFWKLVRQDLQETEWPSWKKVWQTFLVSQVCALLRKGPAGYVGAGWFGVACCYLMRRRSHGQASDGLMATSQPRAGTRLRRSTRMAKTSSTLSVARVTRRRRVA